MGTPIKRLILNDTSYNPINNFKKNPTTMKFLLIVALLPCALAQCPEEELPECQRADMLCGGRPREDGCLSSYWCMFIDPYAKCSSKKQCPAECLDTELMCPGEPDQDGCPTQDTCIPKMTDDCFNHCPVECGEMERLCIGDVDSEGCPLADYCIPDDPGTTCKEELEEEELEEEEEEEEELVCEDNETVCKGAPGTPDTCMKIDPEAPCPQFCPPSCDPEKEVYCNGPVEENGCELEGTCVPYEPTAICPQNCPMYCPAGEWSCYIEWDENGCDTMTCSNGGVCPEIEFI